MKAIIYNNTRQIAVIGDDCVIDALVDMVFKELSMVVEIDENESFGRHINYDNDDLSIQTLAFQAVGEYSHSNSYHLLSYTNNPTADIAKIITEEL